MTGATFDAGKATPGEAATTFDKGEVSYSPESDAFATHLEHLLRAPVIGWLCGHSHYSSAQKYDMDKDCAVSSPRRFTSLDVSKSQPARMSKLRRKLDARRYIIVASNQVGYAHKNEYQASRFNPCMALYVSAGGAFVSLAD